MRSPMSQRSVTALALWSLNIWRRFGTYATTSDLGWPSSPAVSEDDSWFEVYSYWFNEYPECFEVMGKPEYIGDGECDSENNNLECEYDGGDCCICTCVDAEYACADSSYNCRDSSVSEDCKEESFGFNPYAPRYDSSDFPDCEEAGGDVRDIGNGWCSIYNSNEACGYDGGDCCSCTCEDTQQHLCGSNGGYYCQAPGVSTECKEESDSYIPFESSTLGYRFSQYPGCFEAGGHPPGIGNGRCSFENSIAECDYDGGDCCICTCEDDGEKTCGQNPGYLCEDPTVSEECREASVSSSDFPYAKIIDEYPECRQAGGVVYLLGDGTCDYHENIEECGYDGGDCCNCTCEDSYFHDCGAQGYYCRDPNVSAECVEESQASYPNSFESWSSFSADWLCSEANGAPYGIGDSECQAYNNKEECGYDGGDCCICTCVDTESGTCGESRGYWCLDPSVSAECVEESTAYVTSSSFTYWTNFREYPECMDAGGNSFRIGNGGCDEQNSIEECGYDGGDCCICTCVDTESRACGSDGGYYCKDPSVSDTCKNESDSYIQLVSSTYLYLFGQHPGCYEVGGDVHVMNNGVCQPENNNEECAYDGGDCCSCTCEDSEYHTCGDNVYYCQDPTVSAECVEESNAHVPPSST